MTITEFSRPSWKDTLFVVSPQKTNWYLKIRQVLFQISYNTQLELFCTHYTVESKECTSSIFKFNKKIHPAIKSDFFLQLQRTNKWVHECDSHHTLKTFTLQVIGKWRKRSKHLSKSLITFKNRILSVNKDIIHITAELSQVWIAI